MNRFFCLVQFILFFAISVNSAIGQNYNTPTGNYALGTLSTGDANTATGYGASYWSNSVWNTSSHGYLALFQNVGSSNSAYGSLALYNNVYGYENCALGFSAMISNVSGYRNTSIGTGSMYYNNNTGLNTALGYNAMFNNVSGNFNTALGANSGSNCTASYNTYIGYGADANSTGYTNSSAIGANATVTGNNTIIFGDANITSIGGATPWSNYSDKRIKKDIKANVPGLAFIKLLTPVTYHLNLDASDAIIKRPENRDNNGNIIPKSQAQLKARADKEKKLQTGFLAQDVERAAQSINYEFSGVEIPQNEKGLYGLRYSEFVVPLVKATQELSNTQDSLKEQINELRGKIELALKQIIELKNSPSMVCSEDSVGSLNSKINSHKLLTAEIEKNGYLDQNIPNPVGHSSLIRFRMPATSTRGVLHITNQSGQIVKTYNLGTNKNGQILISSETLSNGTYFYSLLSDGVIVDSKKLLIIK